MRKPIMTKTSQNALLPIENCDCLNPEETTLELNILDDTNQVKASCKYLVESDEDGSTHAAFYSPKIINFNHLKLMICHLVKKYTSVKMLYVNTTNEVTVATLLMEACLITDALNDEYDSIF